MTLYRPQFEAALSLFAIASEAMRDRGLERPILVGGGAVEIYSLNAINTGDFDIVTGSQAIFEGILQDHGFVRPSGPGTATRGWIHPDLQFGFEIVSSTLLDGQADRSRVRLIRVGDAGVIEVISIEDMIADRMGQYASGSAPDMLEQAQKLFALSDGADSRCLTGPICTIWISVSATKPQAIMVSKTSSPDPITLEEFGRDVARRRAETGVTDLPRNSGLRRTESKKALLKAIKDAGGSW